MYRRIICLLLVCAMIVLLGACATEYNLAGAKEFYKEYLEMAVKDRYTSVHAYWYLHTTENIDLAASSPEMVGYEIIRWESLSDRLWRVIVYTEEEYLPTGRYFENYVGYMDGRYYVIPNYKNIPEELTDGLDIEPYKPSGENIVDPDDVIGPIEIQPYEPSGESAADPEDVIAPIA